MDGRGPSPTRWAGQRAIPSPMGTEHRTLRRSPTPRDRVSRQRWEPVSAPARSLVGMHLGSLTVVERQALAVYRGRSVDLIGWYERLHEVYLKMDPRATT